MTGGVGVCKVEKCSFYTSFECGSLPGHLNPGNITKPLLLMMMMGKRILVAIETLNKVIRVRLRI